MNLRAALMVAIVLGLCGLGLVTWIGLQLPTHVPASIAALPPTTAVVLVAARPMRAGDLIKYDDIQAHEMSLGRVPEGARADTVRERAELVGAMIRRGLAPNEPLLSADLLRPGDHGFLAAVLLPGMRAATVGVDAVSGTAGLIWPGDHVDVIMTQVSEDQSLPASRRASAQTVLSDVRVIAIDQQLMQGAAAGTVMADSAHTVTLEVTDIQAERIALAARLGHLSFIVRSADARSEPESGTPPTTWGGDVSSALSDGHAVGRVMRNYQGTADVKEHRF